MDVATTTDTDTEKPAARTKVKMVNVGMEPPFLAAVDKMAFEQAVSRTIMMRRLIAAGMRTMGVENDFHRVPLTRSGG